MSDSGKGDKPRPVDRSKWDTCPIWDKIGLGVREKRRRKAADKSELHEQIETHKILYEEYDA